MPGAIARLRRRVRGHTTEGDEGAILLLVLLFLLAVSVVIGALLSAGSASEIATTDQNTFHTDTYAVDGGIEYGLEQLKTNPLWCPNSSVGSTSSTYPTNTAVTVTCQTSAGQSDSVSNWAVATLDTSTSGGGLQSQSGGGTTKYILGPTYVAGYAAFAATTEDDSLTQGDAAGTAYQYSSTCPGSVTTPTRFVGTWKCTTQSPNINVALPTGVPATAPAESTTLLPNCTILYPGTYNAAPTLGLNNYMVSGIYYFNNVGTIDLGNSDSIFGGQPSLSNQESQVVTNANPCATDVTAGGTSQGTGVEIILGGNSSINVDKGNLELYSFQPSSTYAATAGTPGVSLRTVPTGTASWAASTLGNTSLALTSNTGANPQTAIHGFIYFPNASAFLWATNASQAEVLGGIAAWDISMKASASGSGLVVETQTSPTIRTVSLTSSMTYGGKTIKATAAVEVENDTARTVTIDSWTVSNP